jgi:hypothetical protein
LQNKTIHDELIGFLFAELGEFIAPDWLGWRVTPNDLWRKNKTLTEVVGLASGKYLQ